MSPSEPPLSKSSNKKLNQGVDSDVDMGSAEVLDKREALKRMYDSHLVSLSAILKTITDADSMKSTPELAGFIPKVEKLLASARKDKRSLSHITKASSLAESERCHVTHLHDLKLLRDKVLAAAPTLNLP